MGEIEVVFPVNNSVCWNHGLDCGWEGLHTIVEFTPSCEKLIVVPLRVDSGLEQYERSPNSVRNIGLLFIRESIVLNGKI